MSSLSSHVLDTTLGKPAANLQITLTTPDGQTISNRTNQDGRCQDWQGYHLIPGEYKLTFHTKAYLMEHHQSAFYPFVDITFQVGSEDEHYHIPLLISPYSFSSYRGS